MHRVIYGTAYLDVERPDATNIRQYHSSDGRWWTGHDTTDIDYFCSNTCLDDARREWTTEAVDLTFERDGQTFAHTRDIEQVFGDWPDYDVHCARCEELIHEGSES